MEVPKSLQKAVTIAVMVLTFAVMLTPISDLVDDAAQEVAEATAETPISGMTEAVAESTAELNDAMNVDDASAHGSNKAVWIGSPVSGRWACAGNFSTPGSPSPHHTFRYGDRYPGDWGVDICVPAGRSVYLYAAPQGSTSSVTARVKTVTAACAARSGETWANRIKRGGYAVVVEIKAGSTVLGTVKYVHVNPSVRQGQTINRWGTKIGTIGSYRTNGCWDGAHLHMEMTNETHYSCYNRGYRINSSLSRSNFVGFLGGHYAYSQHQRCA